MIRVLHVVGRMDRAGAETMVMNLYRAIDRTKFQFDFVYFSTDRCDYDEEIEALGGYIYRIAATNPIRRLLALYCLLRKANWETVHSHTLFSSALHLTAAKLAGIPHRLAHSHNTQDVNSGSLFGRIYQGVARWLIATNANRFIACGMAAAEYLFSGRDDVVIIPNAVDIERFSRASGAAVREELGIREGQLVVLQVGRFMQVKNHERSIRIAEALKKSGVDFQLILVGIGPDMPRIKLLVRELGLEQKVHFLGVRADIPELMAAADVLLMPSIFEGFPVVLVEAQAVGLPSVVSSSISREVELGMEMVSFLDLEALDEDWSEALRDSAASRSPDVQTRRRVLEQKGFSVSVSASLLQQVYISS